ncbi:hypothetical protein [Paenibacillus sacheonensis]|uniref:Uncharacterized protein n=1 Tax=Paenibacillus sacheonensis TaxID=742054 RepID=A0A7X4YTN2_9BACL|nr:hypothetical protein [Paenibacillus sacheonensis]MBM7568486.1 hypothetical protein [Paenibacillus sacheonensis]NBC72313.1 hypothetical protein [Paenibacillus sacheonensis]
MTRSFFFVGLVMNLMILSLTLFITHGDNLYPFIPLLAVVALHVFYLPLFLFTSLRTEAGHLHLWLHNPQSAAALLLSKILNGLIMTIISLIVLYAMAGLLLISRFHLIEPHWTDTWMAGWLIFVHVILISVGIGVWVILLWSLYHALKYRIGRWNWLVILAAVILPSWIGSLFDSSSLYKMLTQWGSLEMNFPTFSIDPIPAYAGEYLYHFIITVGLFYLSAWIMDRKAEV